MSESITCPDCQMTSYNPNDVREGYCGNCHWWTSDPILGPAREALRANGEQPELYGVARDVTADVLGESDGRAKEAAMRHVPRA